MVGQDETLRRTKTPHHHRGSSGGGLAVFRNLLPNLQVGIVAIAQRVAGLFGRRAQRQALVQRGADLHIQILEAVAYRLQVEGDRQAPAARQQAPAARQQALEAAQPPNQATRVARLAAQELPLLRLQVQEAERELEAVQRAAEEAAQPPNRAARVARLAAEGLPPTRTTPTRRAKTRSNPPSNPSRKTSSRKSKRKTTSRRRYIYLD
jgi:hypothetical protein